MFVLTLAETIKALKPPPCNVKLGEKCEKPTSKEVGFFWLALVFVAISFGGTAPTRAALAVDQFDETVPRERPMLLSFSRRWLLCLSCSALVAQSGIVYVQENIGWGLGFGLPTAGYALAVDLVFCGIPYYRLKVPHGSPLISIAQVLVAATRNHKAHIIPLHKNSTSVAQGNQENRETCKHTHSLR
jgi:peptide/histidine transporter 3/4